MAIKYAILGLLHYQGMHGYQIKKHIEQNFGHMWTVNYGQIYPNLKNLEDEGLISMSEINNVGEKGPSRKQYSITDDGKAEFRRWLEKSPERGILLRDPFLTRFVFFGFGSRERALELIDEQIELYEEQLDYRYENRKHWEKYSMYVKLIADLGVDFNEMVLNWLKRAKEEILEHTEEEKTISTL